MTLKKRKKKSYINQYLNVIVPYTTIAKIIQKFANGLGYEIWHIPRDYSQEDKEIMNAAARYTMTDFAAKKMLIEGIKHIVKHQIEGCFVECGVWKGGSIIIMLKTLQKLGISDREIYLFDTFDMVPAAGEKDVSLYGIPASIRFSKISDSFLLRIARFIVGTGSCRRHPVGTDLSRKAKIGRFAQVVPKS